MIRICTKRDAVCPHGMSCPYADGYDCTEPDAGRPTVEAGMGKPAVLLAKLQKLRMYELPVPPAIIDEIEAMIVTLVAERGEARKLAEQDESEHWYNLACYEGEEGAPSLWKDRAIAAERERDEAQLAAGHFRMCVNCGKTRPFHEPKDPLPECIDAAGYSACTWDATPQEACEYWRELAHDRQAALAAAKARAAELEKALRKIVALDESMGHELKERHAFEAVAIAHATLTGGEDA